MGNVRIALTCYRYIAIPAIAITGIASCLLVQSESSAFLPVALWLKVATTALLILFVHLFRSEEFLFFNNLGYSVLSIYLMIGALEVIITAVFFSLAMQLI